MCCFLYGLANINAIGWQEAVFVLLKCVDERTIETGAWNSNVKYHQTESKEKGLRTSSKRVMAYAKIAMACHCLTSEHPKWNWDWGGPLWGGKPSVRTPWNQNTAGRAPPMNQPQYLADPGIIYRSLAGGKGILRWPPSKDVPGAAWEPFKGGPRQYALDLLGRLTTVAWYEYDDGKGKGKGKGNASGSRSTGNSWQSPSR